MPRVTETEVREIITTAVSPLTAFIAAASLIVDDLADAPCMTDARLKEVERWLSAHMAAGSAAGATGGQISKKKIGDAETSWAVPTVTGDNLRATAFGQTAISLDCSGRLAELGKTAPVFEVLGSC